MNEILLDFSSKCRVIVGKGILKDLKTKIFDISERFCKVVVITDETVDRFYGHVIEKSFENTEFSVFKFVFKSGEVSKNTDTYFSILEFLAENQVSKGDMILAFGGGVVGDLAGFVASTYLRGVKFVNVPTTLLAMVDSSIGGKTGVNLEHGKNLVGTFWHPSLVISDCSVLSTLNYREVSNGMAEVIKYAVIYDRNFFDFINDNDINENLEKVILSCIKIKSHFISLDEFDGGERQKLNFGHTLGHAFEKCSGYKIPHGYAVAAGMASVMKASVKMGNCEKDEYLKLLSILEKYNLPTEYKFDFEEVYRAVLNDKKRVSDTINFILADKIGSLFIYPLSVEKNEVSKFIKMAVS